MTIAGIQVGALLRKVGRSMLATDVLGLAAQTAYYFFFSLFPLILFSAPLLSLLGNKRETVDSIMAKVAPAVPADAYTLIAGVVNDVVFVLTWPVGLYGYVIAGPNTPTQWLHKQACEGGLGSHHDADLPHTQQQ